MMEAKTRAGPLRTELMTMSSAEIDFAASAWFAMQRAEGWTPETIVERVLPAFQPSYFPLVKSSEVFNWDPV